MKKDTEKSENNHLLWSIGECDNSYSEFALVGNYTSYVEVFPEDVRFTVGESQPEKEWPYVHAGPADEWAGRTIHPFKVIFKLEEIPTGDCRLIIDLLAVRILFESARYFPRMAGPLFSVNINGYEQKIRLTPCADTTFNATRARASIQALKYWIQSLDCLHDESKCNKYLLTVPFSSSLLRKGENTITLKIDEGSWIIYDSIRLEAALEAPAEVSNIRSFQVKPTMLFKRENGRLKQVVEVKIDNRGKNISGNIAVEIGGEKIKVPLRKILFGKETYQILIPEVKKPTQASFSLKIGHKIFESSVTIRPQRKWKIFVSPNVHTDLGFTDFPHLCVERYDQNQDIALEALEHKLPGFKWNLETTWQAKKYLQSRLKNAEKLMEFVRNGKVGVEAAYLHLHTGVCSHEELNRLCYFAASLKRKYGISIDSAMQVDIPSLVWSIPTIMAESGVRYFVDGINDDRAPFFWRSNIRAGFPFFWQGPDGSKVLTVFTLGYGQLKGLGLLHSYRTAYDVIPRFLARFNNEDYPYDAVFVLGAFIDTELLRTRYAEIANEWNKRWDYPKLIICRTAEFFEYIEDKFADKIPTFIGDAGCYWEMGVASASREMAIIRRAHEDVVTAEKLSSIVGMVDPSWTYQHKELNKAWEEIFRFDEHTWGSGTSIGLPDSETTEGHWIEKASFAYDASSKVKAILGKSFSAFVSKVKTGEEYEIIVFNPLSWRRTDVAKVRVRWSWLRDLLRSKGSFALLDSTTGRHIRYQVEELNRKEHLAQAVIGPIVFSFVAEDVPSLGYKTLRIVPHKGHTEMPNAVKFFENGFENQFYRIEFDTSTGAIRSIIDKESGKELVDKESPFKLNQYLYVTGGEESSAIPTGPFQKNVTLLPPPNFKRFTPSSSKIMRGQNGPVFGSMIVETSCEVTPNIRYEVKLYSTLKRIDINNTINKNETYEKEAIYFAFPFAFRKPKFEVEVPDAVVRPEIDQLIGACKDWYAVQHWVAVWDDETTVLWTPIDSPMVSLCQINAGKWIDKFDAENGTILAFVMNNYWHTNFKAGQGGHLTFRFSITSHLGQQDRAKAYQFGWNCLNPNLSVVLPPAHILAPQDSLCNPLTEQGLPNASYSPHKGLFPQQEASFLKVNEPNVIVLAIKKAENEDGWIVRLLEIEGKSTKATLSFFFPKLKNAHLCTLIEDDLKPLKIDGANVTVPINGYGIATVRINTF